MADSLIRTWRLAVLRVRLDLTERAPAVASELVTFLGDDQRTVLRRRDPIGAFGLREGSASPPSQLRLPDEFLDALLRTVQRDLPDDAALWLRLVPVYGHLGGVPWETAFVERTGRPFLRVPDRLPVPNDLGSTLSIAVAVNAPLGATWGAEHVTRFVDALRRTSRRPVRVDVFADQRTSEDLTRTLGAVTSSIDVRLHDPVAASAAHEARRRRLPPPGRTTSGHRAFRTASPGARWGAWIGEGLEGRAVQALHVATGGSFDAERPLLALAPDPARTVGPDSCQFVGEQELGRFADTVGAATISFSSPPDDPSETATRVLADALGQQRPGPTLFSRMSDDWHCDAVAAAYQFLSRDALPLEDVPHHRSMFAYLQPEHVASALQGEWPALTSADDPAPAGASDYEFGAPAAVHRPLGPGQAEVTHLYDQSPVVPSWVAATERYIDSSLASLTKTAHTSEEQGLPHTGYEDGAASALMELRAMVARHARPS